MRWCFTDGSREVWIVDEFWDRETPGRVLSPTEGAAMVRSLAADPEHAAALRRLRDPYARPGTDDTFDAFHDPIASTIADVASGRLIVRVVAELLGEGRVPVAETIEPELEEAQPLAFEPEPEQEPAVPPDVLAQVDALLRAAEVGAAFCEE